MSTPSTGRPLAVVTGASSGIGYEPAVQFVEHGYDVVGAGKIIPDRLKAEQHRRTAEPGSGD